jgi:16S rRNA (cytosine967-C5)-methyltransferase
MTPAGRLAAAIELLALVDQTPRPADAVTSAYFRDRRFIGSKDRAEIALSVYRAMRRRARLTWRLERAGAEASPTGMILADLLVGEGRPLEQIERLFSPSSRADGRPGGAAYGPEPLSADEMGIMRRLDGRTLEHPDMPEAVAAECPPWAEAELRRALGDRFRAELDALKDPAPLDLRVNVLKADRAEVLAQLIADGFAATATHLSPIGIRLEGRPSIMAHQLYKDGAIEIQDEGSQLVALIADARPGQEVVDFCAGAGGKTLALAAAMGGKGRVIASDVLANRLRRARERFRRAGAHNVQTRPLTGETDPWVKRHKGRFDRVLVDAPCSGTGTWRRNPDMRWRSLGPGLGDLLPLQARLIDSAARLVKPGGRLIYATCSLLMSENEDHAARFLETHTDFALKPAADIWRESVWPEGGPAAPSSPFLRLTPGRDDTDGFFAAVFERVSPAMESPDAEIMAPDA